MMCKLTALQIAQIILSILSFLILITASNYNHSWSKFEPPDRNGSNDSHHSYFEESAYWPHVRNSTGCLISASFFCFVSLSVAVYVLFRGPALPRMDLLQSAGYSFITILYLAGLVELCDWFTICMDWEPEFDCPFQGAAIASALFTSFAIIATVAAAVFHTMTYFCPNNHFLNHPFPEADSEATEAWRQEDW